MLVVKMEGHGAFFSSEAQERLAALLRKTFDVVPFAADEACNEIFVSLAKFCGTALEKRNLRQEGRFSSLNIEDLIKLSGHIVVDGRVTTEKPGKKSSSGTKRPRSSVETRPSDGESAAFSQGIGRWSFESAYNIVEVVAINNSGASSFQMIVKARPPVAGNKAPSEYVMERADLEAISGFKGKPAKRLRENLCNALEAFFAGNADANPTVLLDIIRPLEWASALCEGLAKTRNKN